jgi:hypothetical protein
MLNQSCLATWGEPDTKHAVLCKMLFFPGVRVCKCVYVRVCVRACVCILPEATFGPQDEKHYHIAPSHISKSYSNFL